MCDAPGCLVAGSVETLSHVFLECPEVVPVIDWLLSTCEALISQAPQRTACLATPSRLTQLCARAAFAAMPGAMRAASARRRLLRLNAFGRSHMAMQCISAKAVFHANF